MRIVFSIMLFLCAAMESHGQKPRAGEQGSGVRITRDYDNVSFSDALRQLNNEASDYEINFLYNELEDFLVTTAVQNKTLPEAILQIIGFYPVRMTVKEGDHGDNQYGADPNGRDNDSDLDSLLEKKDESEQLGGDSVI